MTEAGQLASRLVEGVEPAEALGERRAGEQASPSEANLRSGLEPAREPVAEGAPLLVADSIDGPADLAVDLLAEAPSGRT